MQTFEPAPCLSPYVKAFVVIESSDTQINRLLPDTCVVAAIRLNGDVLFKEDSGDIRLPMWSLSGLRKSYSIVEYGKNSANILVQFREGGAAAFFNLPVHELFGLNVSLDNFFKPSELAVLEEQLQHVVSIEQKVGIVQQFFMARISYQKADLLIADSVKKIKAANGLINVRNLSDSLYISLDAFEKRFRKSVGTTPKRFADIVRMQALITQVEATGTLLEPALDAGFFDQSHFIRDFKKFTGLTPKELLSGFSR
ncbi:helix-turn-helix transcriptional regulator [Dyadobacter aurulentus]|uniref:helix-turn-helix transcriptional regulator n=1 Tax=Dyadobacter sp. UC 10 TaxID=2605428 RepID=UPI0011F3E43F|nr:helix-turn-helix transcriptional regulator [Dyadobacter sp. UC 10]KAA0993521.1 helix-turn-helix transcriptional regulator [Dyadobacter sp. UC 10]